MLILSILFLSLVVFLLCMTMKEPPCLTEVKRRYKVLREYCRDDENVPKKFKILKKQILLTGYTKTSGPLGWNSNKGDEIGICIDGTPNQAFHILLHELAHSTVEEYSHSKKFWANFAELRDMCEGIGIYTPIDHQAKFCGKFIKD